MRYFFHLREEDDYVLDEEGVELPDIKDVRQAALQSARSVIAGDAITGKLSLKSVVEVDDEEGTRVLVLPFREAVSIDG